MVHQHIINCAINEALKSQLQQKHGAVLFKNKTIFTYGHNSKQQILNNFGFQFTTHAEMYALNKYLQLRSKFGKKQKVNLLVVRIGLDIDLACSCPCCNCLKYLQKYSFIKDIYFSNKENSIQKYQGEVYIKYDKKKLLLKIVHGNIINIDFDVESFQIYL